MPNNVPLALSSFVGRGRERDALVRALAESRLTTVTGAGGAGKTRLVREVAAAFAAGGAGGAAPYPDGVWWLELAPVADGALVPQVAAAALGVRPPPGRDVTDAVAEALRGSAAHPRRALLVLDNCEHVIEEAAALAARLLRAAPGLTVLATSREALAVEGEQAWVLPALATPPAAGATPAPAALLGYDAVRLFVERARAARPDFALTPANAGAVAAVAARLDGLPLALELAAAAVPALGVHEVAARLDDVFAVLTRGRRTAPPQHRTLRALLDWSHQLLGPAERTLLARLAVFRGPFTLEAAEAVCADDAAAPAGGAPLPADAVLGALGRLVEQSLVEAGERGGETRFRLLETVRQYGLARLGEAAGAGRAARARHARWALALAAAAEPATWGAGRGRAVARLARDADELRAALDWAAGPPGAPNAGADPPAAVRLAGALAWFWFSGVPWAEARARTARVLEADAAAAGPDDAGRPPAEQAALATLLYPVAGLCYFAGEAAPVLAHARRGLALWDAVDAARAADPAVDAALGPAARRGRPVLEQLAGLAHAMLGDADAAVRALDAAVGAAAAADDAWLHAVMRARRGLMYAMLGRPAAAMADYEGAAPLLRAAGETWFLSMALSGMATVTLAGGAPDAAARHARESIAVLADEPDAWFVSRSLDTLAQIAVTTADRTPPAPARGATAGRLVGAAAGLRARCGAEVLSHDRARHAATLAAARGAAGEEAFAAAWAEGEALDLAGAFALAAAADVADPAAPTATRAARPHVVVSSGRAAVLVADEPAADAPAVRVLCFGPLLVARGGRALGADALTPAKARELLLYLALHPPRTKEQLALALWPDASEARVRSAFHVTLHHLRRILGGRDAVAFDGAAYALARPDAPAPPGAPAAFDCDVDAVLAAAAAVRGADREAERRGARGPAAVDAVLAEMGGAAAAPGAGVLAAWGAALDRARRGPLGAGVDAGEWLAAPRARVNAAWGDGVEALARLHARRDAPAAAAAALATLVAAEPLREGAHRALMACYAAAGEPARALAHYDALAALLAREVGAAPARDTRALAEAIRRDAGAAPAAWPGPTGRRREPSGA